MTQTTTDSLTTATLVDDVRVFYHEDVPYMKFFDREEAERFARYHERHSQ